ncbi:MAG TPA: hypothetical protein VJM13_07685 [Sphingopyxis sp.]|nr:hypothetical protein [Sphingopyxis sp.]
MKKTLIGVTALWGALLLATGPARAQAPVSSSDCQAEQAAMRGLGAPDAAVQEALLPPGVERADTTVDALAAMRDSFRDSLSTAQTVGAREDAATFRLMICAYDAAIARRQGVNPGIAGSMASAPAGGSGRAVPSPGPLPSGKRWGNPCLKIDRLQRARFPQETGKIFDVINFILRNECPVDQLYYLSFGGPESSYVSPEFINRKFQQDAMAAPDSAFLPDPAPSDFRPLLRQPPAHTPNPQAFVQVARAGKAYHMEVPSGEADGMSSPYWSPRQYVIAACDVTRGGYLVKMFFNPDQDFLDCIPKTDGTGR